VEVFAFQISRRVSVFLPSLESSVLVFCFVVPLAFILKLSLVVVVLEAFWDLGNGKHFVISVVMLETVTSYSIEQLILYIDI